MASRGRDQAEMAHPSPLLSILQRRSQSPAGAKTADARTALVALRRQVLASGSILLHPTS